MGFLDNISRGISQGIDRAKFEAEKFQRVSRLQGELNDIRKQIDERRLEFGDRAMELYKAGKIQSPTLGEILRAIETLQVGLTLKEEELKDAQATGFVEPAQPAPPPTQNVPVSTEPPPDPTPHQPATGTKTCPTCQFVMPTTSLFCPSCGTRVG